MAPSAEKPTCVSIILCDDVYRDERTKKLVIVGTFNMINAPSLPYVHPKMVALFTLTNGRGQFDLTLTLEHAETERVMTELTGPMNLDSPMRVIDVNVELRGTEFRAAGKYCLTLKADGEQIATRPFFVTEGVRNG